MRNLAPWVKHLVENLEHVSVCACMCVHVRGVGGEYVLMHEYRWMSRGVGTATTVSELSKHRTKGEQTSTDYTKVGAYLGEKEHVTLNSHCSNNRVSHVYYK